MYHPTQSNLELLSFLIGGPDAERIYKGSLRSLLEGDGGGFDVLHAAKEFCRRLVEEEMEFRAHMNNPDLVRNYLKLSFAGKEHEAFIAIFLDNHHRVLASEEMFRGTVNQAAVYPREIVKRCLRMNASALVIAHNHPSGVAEPSGADTAMTRKLKQALALVDIRLLDHMIIGGNNHYSYAEHGQLE